MLHSIVLAGVEARSGESRVDLPMFLEQSYGTCSRFREVLRSLSGDVFEAPLVVAGLAAASEVSEQMKQEGRGGALLLEPGAHNPAAGILAGLLRLRDTPEKLVVITPATMNFGTAEMLDRALCHAIPAAKRGEVVLLSERTAQSGQSTATLEVDKTPIINMPAPVSRVGSAGQSFLDGFLQKGHVVWSTGVIVARVDVLLAAYKRHASRMFLAVKSAVNKSCFVMDGILLDEGCYGRLKPRSFEALLGSKLDRLATIPLGKPVREQEMWDADLAEDQGQSTPLSRSPATPELHASRVLEALRVSTRAIERRPAPGVFPWGRREVLADAVGLSVARLTVSPGCVVELGATCSSDQHWIVEKGTALVTMGTNVKFVSENQGTRVPADSKRRIENPGQTPLFVLQVQVEGADSEDQATDKTLAAMGIK